MLLYVLAAADLAAAMWMLTGWGRQVRHREAYVLTFSLLFTCGVGLLVLAVTGPVGASS